MSNLNYKFGPKNTYLVACTFGPDSMALVDMMQKDGAHIVVLFVNYVYNGEDSSAKKEVERFCFERRLVLETVNVSMDDHKGSEHDIAAWARDERYKAFKEAFDKYGAAALFIAHHQDDVIENYLLRKSRGAAAAKYGWERITAQYGMIIVRPLLAYTREDLIGYCQENNVPFSVSFSNYEEATMRSAVRHDIVSRLNEVERGNILDQIRKEKAEIDGLKQDVNKKILEQDELDIRPLIALTSEGFAETIINFVNAKCPSHTTVTPKMLSEIRAMCLNEQPFATYHMRGSYYMVKEYDVLSIDVDGLDLPYSYVLEKPGKFSCRTFDLDFSNGAEDRNIKESDYPLTIRSSLPQDVTTHAGYLCSVRRMLVASGISQRLLRVWPVFLNNKGEIVYVPRYRKGFNEYHSSILNIRVTNDEK